MIKFIENGALESYIKERELTSELIEEIKQLEKNTKYRYHYIYSYSIDTEKLFKENKVFNKEYIIYVGEGELRRILENNRDFKSTKLYKELLEKKVTIKMNLQAIYRTTDENINLKLQAKTWEKYLIESFNPFFNKDYQKIYKYTEAIKKDRLYVLFKKDEIMDIGYSIKCLERDDIKKSTIGRISKEKTVSSKGYYIKFNNELSNKEKIHVNLLLEANFRSAKLKKIFKSYDIDISQYLQVV